MTQSAAPAQRHVPTPDEFVAAQQSPEFQELRSKMRGFTFPMTVFFIVWFVLYVSLAMFAPNFMGIKIWGNINVGVLLGFGQFITTFLITYLYVKYADREIEPRAQHVRESLEGSPATPASQASRG
ncbi:MULTISPECIES: DUF485 domain-containing protein [Corynebacterium]|uniref:DUF485 domain-containing protein n=1 Tax=Corynebacterium urealyticum TaxID=43771 RepID=A0A5D4FY55_9CORY|nr:MULTISPECIES: DUF485 domain-containing protein [Corynebacterium]MDK6302032.1 DUF485 domain-containing protein [Corynebacterium sp. UMB9976]TYR20814.1 DUF485 domain-containing protein [Corynebacterium urealyticum]WOH94039.1 DUF485 domain-containing protein [Corynebacterium urealyticum]